VQKILFDCFDRATFEKVQYFSIDAKIGGATISENVGRWHVPVRFHLEREESLFVTGELIGGRHGYQDARYAPRCNHI
jgi:hypothetical protein